MKQYTVVGIYRDNKQIIVDFIPAEDPEAAAKKVEDRRKFLSVISVFNGKHEDLYCKDKIMEWY